MKYVKLIIPGARDAVFALVSVLLLPLRKFQRTRGKKNENDGDEWK
jgi:hypothetical protein